jgi:hypothetical protein
MVSPIIDEEKMLKFFDAKVSAAGAMDIQSGAFLLLADAFDRRVTREDLKTYLSAALQVYDTVGRLSIVSNMRMFLREKGEISDADLMVTEQSLTRMVTGHVADCIKLAEVLRQCATDEDKIQ